jgi:hypothetical protein
MALRLHVKRTKMFMLHGASTRQFQIQAGQTVMAPEWVKQTRTYGDGLKDESIVDLTPPRPVAAIPEPEEKAPEAEPEAEPEAPPAPKPDPTDEELEAAQAQERQRRGTATRLPTAVTAAVHPSTARPRK